MVLVCSNSRLQPELENDTNLRIMADENSQKTRATMFNLLQSNPAFQKDLGARVGVLTRKLFTELLKCTDLTSEVFAGFTEKQRRNLAKFELKLETILLQAARLYLETLEEPAIFQYVFVDRKFTFNPTAMNAVEVHNTGEEDPVIEIGATPIVTKTKYGSPTSMVLRKAKIYLQQKRTQKADQEQPAFSNDQQQQAVTDKGVDHSAKRISQGSSKDHLNVDDNVIPKMAIQQNEPGLPADITSPDYHPDEIYYDALASRLYVEGAEITQDLHHA